MRRRIPFTVTITLEIFLLPPSLAEVENRASLNIPELSGVKWKIKMIRETFLRMNGGRTLYGRSETLTFAFNGKDREKSPRELNHRKSLGSSLSELHTRVTRHSVCVATN